LLDRERERKREREREEMKMGTAQRRNEKGMAGWGSDDTRHQSQKVLLLASLGIQVDLLCS
jgi:hypothetical protein